MTKKGLVYTNENCVGCNKCISVCSCVGAMIANKGDKGETANRSTETQQHILYAINDIKNDTANLNNIITSINEKTNDLVDVTQEMKEYNSRILASATNVKESLTKLSDS